MFTARFQDEETGLMYYRARHYAPKTGRFLQRDPVGYQANANIYGYVACSPPNLSDPLGEKEVSRNPDEKEKAKEDDRQGSP
jgi:RHS repeat-associated protein